MVSEKKNKMKNMQRTDRSIVGAMCRVQLNVRKRSTDIMFTLGLKETTDQLAMVNRIPWYGHVLRREDDHILRTSNFEADGQRKKWRQKRTWKKQVEGG